MVEQEETRGKGEGNVKGKRRRKERRATKKQQEADCPWEAAQREDTQPKAETSATAHIRKLMP